MAKRKKRQQYHKHILISIGLGVLVISGFILHALFNTTTLRNSQAQTTIPPTRIGAAVTSTHFSEADYANTLITKGYSILTPENEMKMDATQPQQGVWNFAGADAIVNFAQQHGMQVHGHNLVWHSQVPSWVTSGNFTAAQLSQILEDRINTMMSRYKGKVAEWDVVNEAIDDSTGNPMRQTIWSQIGSNYIDLAFQWAKVADPNAKLYYNDYGIEGLGPKSDAVYNMVAGMKQRGVPIDGVGMQMHIGINGYQSESSVAQNIARFKALGVLVSITEMDVSIGESPGTQTELNTQADIYQSMATVCRDSGDCPNFITWGFTDKYSWIPAFTGHPDAPLPFDANYNPKPAYYRIRDVFALPISLTPTISPTRPPISISIQNPSFETLYNGYPKYWNYWNGGSTSVEYTWASDKIKKYVGTRSVKQHIGSTPGPFGYMSSVNQYIERSDLVGAKLKVTANCLTNNGGLANIKINLFFNDGSSNTSWAPGTGTPVTCSTWKSISTNIVTIPDNVKAIGIDGFASSNVGNSNVWFDNFKIYSY